VDFILHVDEVKAFLDLLTSMSLDFDHLIELGYFDISEEILDSLLTSFFPVPSVVTRLASGTCIDHVLTKFPENVISFDTQFSSALLDNDTFSYCIRPTPLVFCFADFLSYQV
jgi:hypothetical protein